MAYIAMSNVMKCAEVDEEDEQICRKFSWYAKHSRNCDYPCASVRHGNRVKTLRLHRFIAQRMGILEAGDSVYEVHHIDGDRYNCMRANLTILTPEEHGRVTREGNTYVPF